MALMNTVITDFGDPANFTLAVPATLPGDRVAKVQIPVTNGNGFFGGIVRLYNGYTDGSISPQPYRVTFGWRPIPPQRTFGGTNPPRNPGRIMAMFYDSIGLDPSDEFESTSFATLPDFQLLKDKGAVQGSVLIDPARYYYIYPVRPDYPQSTPLLIGQDNSDPPTDLDEGFEIIIQHYWPDPVDDEVNSALNVDLRIIHGVL